MDITSIAGLGILSAVLCMIVRRFKPDAAIGISIACGVLIMMAVMDMLAPSISAITELTSAAGLDTGYAQALMKALAVCYITQLASDSCRDAGESAIASKIELAGKAAIVAISLPVFASLAELVTDLINVI